MCKILYGPIYFISLGIYPGMSLLGYMETMFNFSWNCQTVVQNDCIILHSHPQYMRVPVVHILANTHYVFFVAGILMCVKCYFSEVWICISPLGNDIGNLFMCLLTICLPFLEALYFISFPHF